MTNFLISNTKNEKNKKSSSEAPDAPEAPEPPESQISYVQSYERLTSFRTTIVKNGKILLLPPETPEAPVPPCHERGKYAASDDPVGRLPSMFVKKGIPVFAEMPFILCGWLAVFGIMET